MSRWSNSKCCIYAALESLSSLECRAYVLAPNVGRYLAAVCVCGRDKRRRLRREFSVVSLHTQQHIPRDGTTRESHRIRQVIMQKKDAEEGASQRRNSRGVSPGTHRPAEANSARSGGYRASDSARSNRAGPSVMISARGLYSAGDTSTAASSARVLLVKRFS